MWNKFKHIRMFLTVVSMLLLTGCSDEDVTTSSEGVRVRIAVNEEPWEAEKVMLTRAGETMTSLKSTGFGLFSTSLGFNNQEVTWSSGYLEWDFGSKVLWPDNTVPAIGSLDLRAYAPYNYTGSAITMTDNKITFAPAVDNTTDLLWAERAVSDNGTVTLNFQHALARLSFGTITNNYGRDITLTGITASGSLYTTGDLSLTDGTWTASTTETRNYASSPSLAVSSGSTVSLTMTDILQIPGPTVNVTFTFTSTDFGTQTVTTSLILEQSQHKTLNLTLGLNHEVVVE